jgi:hypothetical protein
MTRSSNCSLVLAVALLLITSLRLAAADTNAPAEELDNLSKAEILKLIHNLAEELKQTRSELEQLKAARPEEKPKVAPAAVPSTNATTSATSTSAAPTTVSAPAGPEAPPKEKTEAEKDQERLERERAIQSVQSSDVLLPQGKFDVEPSFSYSHTSLNYINVSGFSILPVLVIGDIESLRVERDIFQSSLALRYGILPNLQADFTVPWEYEQERFVTQSYQNNLELAPAETDRGDFGIGDISFGLSYQAVHEQGSIPDVIVQTEARAPTGKSEFDNLGNDELPLGMGVWGIREGATAIKTLDPVILIASTGYTYNFDREFSVQRVTNTGTNLVNTIYEPGGSIDAAVAIAIAMNPSFAMNLGVTQLYTFSSDLHRIGKVQGSSLNESQLRFGFAWAVNRSSVLNFTAAAGLTEDTPGVTITISYPTKF